MCVQAFTHAYTLRITALSYIGLALSYIGLALNYIGLALNYIGFNRFGTTVLWEKVTKLINVCNQKETAGFVIMIRFLHMYIIPFSVLPVQGQVYNQIRTSV